MATHLKLRPGQKRRVDPNHPREEQRRKVQDQQLKERHGTELSNQKIIQDDLRSLSDKHRDHGGAVADVSRIATEQAASVKEAMRDPRYTGMRPEGPDNAFRAFVDRQWEEIYPDKEPEDRDLNPSTGRPLHRG